MSLAGQWDAVNGEVLRCPAVDASMDPDHQLERRAISDFATGRSVSWLTAVANDVTVILCVGAWEQVPGAAVNCQPGLSSD